MRRRIFSPLNEMDGVAEDELLPDTPLDAGAPLTLQAMATLLDEKLKPVTDTVGNIQARLGVVEKSLDETCARVLQLEQRAESPSPSVMSAPMDMELNKKIAEIEEKFMNLSAKLDDSAAVAVVGGMKWALSKDDAEYWFTRQLKYIEAPTPIETFAKGDFTGLLFARFATKAERDTAVSKIRASKFQWQGETMWAKADMPLRTNADALRLLRIHIATYKHLNARVLNVSGFGRLVVFEETENGGSGW